MRLRVCSHKKTVIYSFSNIYFSKSSFSHFVPNRCPSGDQLNIVIKSFKHKTNQIECLPSNDHPAKDSNKVPSALLSFSISV